MSYLVLARKYRPQNFEEIVGQEHVTRTLASAITKGRVHHAFLFCGARGVGKTTAARILAKCLSCVNAPTPTPCNVCDSCNEITIGGSVDVQEVDGASNNSVEDIRTLRENVRYLPVRGKKKVYIIDEVHMLSTGAFNALLKTLEEPPPHAVFIFATTEVHKIPITILSRVQRYDFRLVSSQRIAEHLARVLTDEKIAFDPGALMVVAREAGGSVRDALSLLEQVLAVGGASTDFVAGETNGHVSAGVSSERAAADALGVADRGLVAELGRAVLSRDAETALRLVASASERNVDIKHLGQVLLEHIRNLVVARVVRDPHALIEAPAHELKELVETALAPPEGLLPLLFDRAARIVDEVTRSPMPRFAFEVGLVELCHIEPLEPIGDLIDRLEGLEGRLGSSAPRPASPSRPMAAGGASASVSVRNEVRTSQPAPVAVPRSPVPAVSAPWSPPSSTMAPSVLPSGSPSGSSSGAPPVSETPPARAVRANNWNDLTQQILARRPSLASLLLGEEVEFSDARIIVAFSDTYARRQAMESHAVVTALMREIQNLPSLVLEIREGKGKAPSVDQAAEQERKDQREQRLREAVEHPARKVITRAFGDDVSFKEPDVE